MLSSAAVGSAVTDQRALAAAAAAAVPSGLSADLLPPQDERGRRQQL